MTSINGFCAGQPLRPALRTWTRAVGAAIALLAFSHCQASDEEAARKELTEVATRCRNNLWFSSYLECGCVEQEFKKGRQSEVGWDKPSTDAMLEKVQDRCPNKKDVISAYVEKNCFETFKNTRTDARPLCLCIGDRVSTSFVGKPNSNMRHVERLRRDAMVACGGGKSAAK